MAFRALGLLVLSLSVGCTFVLDFSDDPAPDEPDSPPPMREPDAPPPPCANGVLDGDETAIDCGGPTCDPCQAGAVCLAARDCVSGACALGFCEEHPRNCASILAARPTAPSEVELIDLDGDAGALEPFFVYCEQMLMGGGWQLVSDVPQGGVVPPATTPVAFVGPGFCTDPATPCSGQIHPSQVLAETEVAIRDVATGDSLILSNFSASAMSGLRYLSLERSLTTSDLCTDPHVCSVALDPDLVATTSGYPMAYTPPLLQWWRLGGWYIGAGNATYGAGSMAGNVFRTNYNFMNALSTRATAAGMSTIQAAGEQRVFVRVPAVPVTGPSPTP